MAAITDKFNKAANGNGTYPSIASVTMTREKNGSVLTCDDLTGWATDTAVHFSTYRLMPDDTVDASTQIDWKGIVNSNTITQMTRLAGNNDNGHLIGDKVELNPTIGWLDDLITGLLKSHNQDGSLKDNVIQAKNIATKTITASKIADNTVSSQNIDWSTLTSKNLIKLGDKKIMWGQHPISISAGTTITDKITLPEAMQNTDYDVILSPYTITTDLSDIEHIHPAVKNSTRTTTSFEVGIYNDVQKTVRNLGIKWIAIG